MRGIRRRVVGVLAVLGAVCIVQPVVAGTITLHSGNGGFPGPDAVIHMLVGPVDGPFNAAFTPADFAAAAAGPLASIALPAVYKPHLDSDPAAAWIVTSDDDALQGSALYALDFLVAAGSIASATLDFAFLVDNALGDAINAGLFLNGLPLAGSTRLGIDSAHFLVDQHFPTFDVSALLTSGRNTLYINAADHGSNSALQFSATITVQVAGEVDPVPEPSTMLLLGTGLLGVVGCRWRRAAAAGALR